MKGKTLSQLSREAGLKPDTMRNVFRCHIPRYEAIIARYLDNRMCEQGMPRFVMAYIDIRLGRFICSSSAWNITDHVLRYLILDCSPAPAAVQEVA
ncbi:hypothetical protein F0D81_04405 [Escherichia coli]|nr:hypothetical protein [Escherichia coli]